MLPRHEEDVHLHGPHPETELPRGCHCGAASGRRRSERLQQFTDLRNSEYRRRCWQFSNLRCLGSTRAGTLHDLHLRVDGLRQYVGIDLIERPELPK